MYLLNCLLFNDGSTSSEMAECSAGCFVVGFDRDLYVIAAGWLSVDFEQPFE